MALNEKVTHGSNTTKEIYFPVVLDYIKEKHKDLKI